MEAAFGEKDILDATNKVRTDPKCLIPLIEEELSYMKDGVIWKPGTTVGMRTHENGDAHREAIGFLEKQAPLAALKWDDNLAKAANDHAKDIGPNGVTGHTGTDGSSMSQRIERYTKWSGQIGENIDFGTKPSALHVLMALVVDDGVSTRGHRKNTFSEDFTLCGVGVAPHTGYGTNYVFDFAGSTGEGAGGGGGGGGAGADIPYDMNNDPDWPEDATGVSISVSTKTEGNKTIKTTTKTYTLKGGATQTVTQTQTTIRS